MPRWLDEQQGACLKGGREGRRGTFLKGTSDWSAGRVQQQPAALRECDFDSNNQFLRCAWVEHTSLICILKVVDHNLFLLLALHFVFFLLIFSTSPDVPAPSSMSTLGGMCFMCAFSIVSFNFKSFFLQVFAAKT
jgi:hypothetical protein